MHDGQYIENYIIIYMHLVYRWMIGLKRIYALDKLGQGNMWNKMTTQMGFNEMGNKSRSYKYSNKPTEQ